jgi:hypothetical protein
MESRLLRWLATANHPVSSPVLNWLVTGHSEPTAVGVDLVWPATFVEA